MLTNTGRLITAIKKYFIAQAQLLAMLTFKLLLKLGLFIIEKNYAGCFKTF